MKTPDPTPALLPPAHLAEIRERADAPLRPMPDAEERAEYFGQAIADRAALLAHLDALYAGPPEDGGEALGRGLFDHLSAMAWPNGRGEIGGPGWDALREDSRSFYRAAALALYTQGFAAGAVAISGESDDPATAGAVLLLMQRRDREQREAHAAGRAEGEAERVRATQEGIDIGRDEANGETDEDLRARCRAVQRDALAQSERN